MLYVVHMIPEQSRQEFKSHPAAYKAFKIAARRKEGYGSVGMWRFDKDGWRRLYASEYYPEALTEPYVKQAV
jgi:hypothetical protein